MTGATGYVSAHHHVHIGAYPIPASTYRTIKLPAPVERNPLDHSGDLRRYLLKRPSNARQSWTPATKGIMSLKQVASFFDDPKSAAQNLANAGFQTAATTNWLDPADNQVEIRLIRFDTDPDAQRRFTSETHGNWSDPDMKDASGTYDQRVPGSEAMTFTNGKKNKYGDQTTEGIAIRGDVLILIWVTQVAPQSKILAEALTYQQWSKL